VFAKRPKYCEQKSINLTHNFKILMDSVENYSRQWAECENDADDTLFEMVKSVRSLIQIIIIKNLMGL
jgi:hypothetical protein